MKQFTLRLFWLLAFFIALPCVPVFASDPISIVNFSGENLSLMWIIPFVGMLLSLAFLPVLWPRLWHAHYGKVSAFWGLITLAMLYNYFAGNFSSTLHIVLETFMHHYIPFMVLISALFVISGGIAVIIVASPTPWLNAGILLLGSLLANFIGTTGAAMLMIRPLLKLNQTRQHKTHTLIFFIFLVCNIGGCLTPLGDPPLFLGFLNGVDFWWTAQYLSIPFALSLVILLSLYLIIDVLYYQKEDKFLKQDPYKVVVQGKQQLIYLFGLILTIILSGLWHSPYTIRFLTVEMALSDLLRDSSIIVLTILSWRTTHPSIHRHNEFSWEPLYEVARLFAAIFITAVPVIALLKAGQNGALGKVISLLTHNGQHHISAFFWLTGLLSAFLDNAPTYLIFFNAAGGDASTLMNEHTATLMAISCGAVFMGALSYIGNAPNFMVKSIAETYQVSMPSFFLYLVWSCGILLPIFGLLTWLFF